jgi:hypothetical protein
MTILRANLVQSLGGKTLLTDSGSIIQTVFVRSDFRGSFSSIPSGIGTTISPLGITITPRSSTSRLICQWMINGELHQDNVFLMHRDGVLITTSGEEGYNRLSGNLRWSGLASGWYDQNESTTPSNWLLMYSQISGSLAPRIYCPAIRSSSSGSYSFQLNRTFAGADVGSDNVERMISMGYIHEVAI